MIDTLGQWIVDYLVLSPTLYGLVAIVVGAIFVVTSACLLWVFISDKLRNRGS